MRNSELKFKVKEKIATGCALAMTPSFVISTEVSGAKGVEKSIMKRFLDYARNDPKIIPH